MGPTRQSVLRRRSWSRFGCRTALGTAGRTLRLEPLEDRRLLDATPLAAEFQVNDVGNDMPERFPAVARDIFGNAVVVWDEGGYGGSVFGRRYDAEGQAGDQFRLDDENDDDTTEAREPDVAMDDAGNSFVVWSESRPGDTFDPRGETSVDTIVGRKFGMDGSPVGDPVELVFDDPYDLDVEAGIEPKIAMDGDGDFVVVYTRGSIYARRFDKGGVQKGGEIVVSEGVPGSSSYGQADVAMAANGDFVVVYRAVWLEDGISYGSDIFLQSYSADGTPGGYDPVNSRDVAFHSDPAIAMAADGKFVVSWTSFGQDGDDNGIFAQAFDKDGSTIGQGEFQVNTTTRRVQEASDISIDRDGVTFTVVWNGFFLETAPFPGDHRKVFMQQFRLDRQEGSPEVVTGVSPLGGEMLVNQSDKAGRGGVGSFFPAVAGSNCGDLFIAWVVNAPVQEIFARMYNVDKFPGLMTYDSDGDGLPDCWEMHGYSMEVEGVNQFIPLDAMGADPLRKDIFVEVDYMEGDATHPSHRPSDETMHAVRWAFAEAPVENLDGSTGITIHIDDGGVSPMNPGNDGEWGGGDDIPWISIGSQSQKLPHDDLLGAEDAKRNYLWDEFDALKFGPDGQPRTLDDRFLPARAAAFHYVIFAHDTDAEGSSGISRNADDAAFFGGASDFIVSLGSWTNGIGNVVEQAGTFMHELGHNLGLGHGGGDHIGYKPNYLSVMNYSFQTRGLVAAPWTGNGFAGTDPGGLDYSRFLLNPLNEEHLNESAGLSGDGFDPAEFGTVYYIGDNEDPANEQEHFKSTSSVDWNADGTGNQADVRVDINGDKAFTILQSYNDWENLVFSGGGIGGLGAGLNLPQATHRDALTFDVASQQANPYKIAVSGPPQLNTAPGASLQVTFTVDNLGSEADTYDLAIRSLEDWGDAASFPATIAVPAGQSGEVSVTVNVPDAADLDDFDELTLIATSQGNSGFLDVATTTIALANSDQSPTVEIASPTDGSQVVEGSAVAVTIDAQDDVAVTRVDLLVDGVVVTSDTTAPFTGQFVAPGAGQQVVLTAVAVDTLGQMKTSAAVNLTVTEAEPLAPLDLGAIDFVLFENLNLTGGSLYYQIKTTYNGVLSSQVDVPTPPKSARLKLYDDNPLATPGLTPLAKSALDPDANQRIDWDVAADETYYVEVYGSNDDLDLRIANLVHHEGTTVTAQGTDGDDVFAFAPTGSYQVTINGVAYHFDDAEVDLVQFDGGNGNDTASIEDSVGNDVYTVTPDSAQMVCPGVTIITESCSVVHGYAKHGGSDTAVLIDSPGKDKIKAEDGDTVKMYNSGRSYYNRARFFEKVEVNFSEGGTKDDARLWDSPEPDIFDGRPGNARYYSENTDFDVTVVGADFLTVRTTNGGDDRLILHDSPGDDVFRAKPHKVEMLDRGTGGEIYKIIARGFKDITAYADQAGRDIAKLYDSTLDDLWEAEYREGETWSLMTSTNRALYEALAFEQVKGYSVNGGTNTLRKRIAPPEIDFVLTHGDWVEV